MPSGEGLTLRGLVSCVGRRRPTAVATTPLQERDQHSPAIPDEEQPRPSFTTRASSSWFSGITLSPSSVERQAINAEMTSRLLDSPDQASGIDVASQPRTVPFSPEIQRPPAEPSSHHQSLPGTPAPNYQPDPAAPSSPWSPGGAYYIEIDDWETDVCAICLAQVEGLEEAGRLPCTCTAVYHRDCVARWLLKNNSCPQCRHSAIIPSEVLELSTTDAQSMSRRRRASNSGEKHANCSTSGLKPYCPSPKGDAAFSLEDVAYMYHVQPPFDEVLNTIKLPDSPIVDDQDDTEVWARIKGLQSAVLVVTKPPLSNDGIVSIYRGLAAMQGALLYSQGPAFMAVFHPEVLLQSPEYAATTRVVWRILDAEEGQAPPPWQLQQLFMLTVYTQQAVRRYIRWVRTLSASRVAFYVVLLLLVAFSLLLGLQQMCTEVGEATRCGQAYRDSLVRKVVLYSSYT